MPTAVAIRAAQAADVTTIAQLADRIWRTYYSGIVPLAQIDYMLAQRYATAVLQSYIDNQDHWFDLLLLDQQVVGFAHYFKYDETEIKLDKLYLAPEWHGQGHGSHLLKHVTNRAQQLAYANLILAVNKQNQKAINTYLRNGFTIRSSNLVDIGGGFVMDDYVMAKPLGAA